MGCFGGGVFVIVAWNCGDGAAAYVGGQTKAGQAVRFKPSEHQVVI